MAKKKSESSESNEKKEPAAKKAAEKKSSPAKAATPKSAAAKAAPSRPAPAGAPLIDTSLAANAAAAMVAGKVATPAGSKSQPKKESAAFKQLKAGLNKPSAGALGGAFGVPGQQKKNVTQLHGGNRQVGHNQTFGADVTRTGVPRRTPG